MELFKANAQWSSRPADERFTSVDQLYQVTKSYADTAGEKAAPWGDLRTEAIDGDVQLVGRVNVPAKLTNWAFGQLAARVEAPAEYLRKLPATLAVQNLNHGLKERGADGSAQLLFHQNGGLLCRAITSDRYSRIWNYEVAERLQGLAAMGWEPATPDIRGDGDLSNPKNFALYASDHDLFAFLRNPNLAIEEKGQGAVYRGVIAEHSEVGAAASKLTRFLYREMCGNHIIWGASKVVDLNLRHVGQIKERLSEWSVAINRYLNSSVSDEEAMIGRARTGKIADTKDGVLDRILGLRSLRLTKKSIEAGYDATLPEQDGDPKTVWGLVQGLTRHSQETP